MEETILMALEYFIRAFIIILGPFVIKLVANKINEGQMDKIRQWVRIAVEAAEKRYGEDQGVNKKEFVVAFVRKKVNQISFINLSYEEIDNLIEAIVYEVKELERKE